MFEQEKKELERRQKIDDLVEQIEKRLCALKAIYSWYTLSNFKQRVFLTDWRVLQPNKILPFNRVKVHYEHQWEYVWFTLKTGWFSKLQFKVNEYHEFFVNSELKYNYKVSDYEILLEEINQAINHLRKQSKEV